MDEYIFFLLRVLWRCFRYSVIAVVLLFYSCGRSTDAGKQVLNTLNEPGSGVSSVRHAVGFDLIKEDQYQILHLFRHYNELKDTLSFVLRVVGAEVDPKHRGIQEIQVPLYDIALLHSSYLSFFKLLNVTDHLSAISEGKYVYDHELYSSVISGALPEVGHGESLDKEKLLALGVSSVFTVGWPNVPNKSQQILGELGIPVLIFSDWQETTLLGRLEWIKVIAAFTGKGEVADSIFSEIESRYEYLRSQARSVDEKPEVVCNLPYKGSWYLPGGNSYVSNVLQDAGASYLWSGHPETGGVQIDFEAVYAKGIMADYWINTGFARRIDEIVSSDERLKDFKAVATGKVFNNNRRVARDAANDYWESGIVRPDIILADLISIFHPDLLPDHELYYYQNLN